jgi:hypothetical protein
MADISPFRLIDTIEGETAGAAYLQEAQRLYGEFARAA